MKSQVGNVRILTACLKTWTGSPSNDGAGFDVAAYGLLVQKRPNAGHISTMFERKIQRFLHDALGEDPVVFVRGPR